MTYGIDYTPIAGDNTSALNTAIASAVSGGQTLFLPPGIIGIAGSVVIPSHARVMGQDRSATTIQKISNSSVANMIVTIGGGSDIVLRDFTVDGNSQNQSGAFYPIGFSSVSRVTIERVACVNPWGTTLWINGSDDMAYRPVPDGAQINFDVTVRDCVFDGTNQRARNGDMVVLGRVKRGAFSNNRLTGAGANMLALQFLTDFKVRENYLSNFWRAAYLETCQFTSVADNDFDTLGTPASEIGDARPVVIWATSADESYPGGGYNSCRYIDITHNRIRNIWRSSGSTGLAAVAISGASGNRYAINNRVERNIIAGGFTQDNKGYAIVVEGGHAGSTIDGNSIWAYNGALRIGDAYAGGQSFSDVGIKDNVAESCNTFGLSAVSTGYGQLSLIGNRMGSCSNSIQAGISSTAGYVSANNQGF